MHPLCSPLREGRLPGCLHPEACPFVYAYEAWGHTYMGCLQKVFDVEIDLQLLESAEATVSGFGAVRALRAPLPMCEVEVVETYASREDELGCRTPSSTATARARQLPSSPSWRTDATGRSTGCRPVASEPSQARRGQTHGSDPVSASAPPTTTEISHRVEVPSLAALVHPGLHDRGKGLERRMTEECREPVADEPLADELVAIAVRAERRLRVVHVEDSQPLEPHPSIEVVDCRFERFGPRRRHPTPTSGTNRGRGRDAGVHRGRRARRARRPSGRSCRRRRLRSPCRARARRWSARGAREPRYYDLDGLVEAVTEV